MRTPAEPRVSVVVPCYDHARFLPEAVESVVAQTVGGLELVVVDDGSPDDTAAVAERLIAAHPGFPMRLVRRPNGGLPAARNTGIAATTGELLCCLDADDQLTPTYLEEAIAALDAHPEVGIVYGDRFNFGDVEGFERHLPYDFELLKHANFLNVAAVFRRSAYDAVGGYKPMTSYEDWEFWLSCGELGFPGLHVPTMRWRYRVREGSMYSQAKKRDQKLKAEIVLYHPRLYGPQQTRWAKEVLAGDEAALAAGTEIGRIPGEQELAASAPQPRSRDLRVLAIVPTYNEADVLEHALRALVEDGIDVYVIDNCSTDGTAEVARALVGHGVVHVEQFPDDTGFDARARDSYMWGAILTRIEQVAAAASDYDWIVFSNADEFRESPWPDVSFREGLALVDRLGFTAVDFALYNFRPTDDGFVPGTDVREHLRRWERGEEFDGEQIKAWRNTGPVQLAPTGGHSVAFDGRRVFPIRFLLRHYPIRGETHGRRKVFGERLARFDAEERANGWHVQYDDFAAGERSFLWDPAALTEWDGDAIRLGLLGDGVRDLLTALFLRDVDLATAPIHVRELSRLLAAAGEAAGGVDSALEAARALAERWPLDGERLLERVDPRTLPGLAETCDLLRGEAGIAGDPLRRRRFADVRDAVAERISPGVEIPGLAVVAFAGDLLAAPQLLARYCDAFSPADPVTLAVLASGDEIERLAALVPDESPDVLAVPRSSGLHWAPGNAAALYGPASRPGLDRLPRFDDSDLAGLRRHLDLPVERAA